MNIITPTQEIARLSLRPHEAADAIGISKRKLWQITKDKSSGIPHFRLGKVILYPVAELKSWLAEQAASEDVSNSK